MPFKRKHIWYCVFSWTDKSMQWKKILFKLNFFWPWNFFNFSLHSKNELQKLFSCYVYCYPFLAQLSFQVCFYAQSLFVCLSWWHDETYILEIKKKLYEFFKKEFDLQNIENIFFLFNFNFFQVYKFIITYKIKHQIRD